MNDSQGGNDTAFDTDLQLRVLQQVRRVIDTIGKPQPSCAMPPWDEMAFFDPPKLTIISTVNGIPQPLCDANPMRVCLIIGVNTTAGAILNVGPDPNLGVTLGAGLSVQGATLPLVFTQQQHGNLCQVAWFVNTTSGGLQIPVVQVLLNRWSMQTR